MRLGDEERGRTAGAYLLSLRAGRAPRLHGRGEIQRATVQADALGQSPWFMVEGHIHQAASLPGLRHLSQYQLQRRSHGHRGQSFPVVEGKRNRRQRWRWLGLLLGFHRGRVREEPGAFLLAALLPYQVKEGPARAAPAIASTGQHATSAFKGQRVGKDGLTALLP